MLLSSKVDYKIQLDVEMKQISKLKPLETKKNNVLCSRLTEIFRRKRKILTRQPEELRFTVFSQLRLLTAIDLNKISDGNFGFIVIIFFISSL